MKKLKVVTVVGTRPEIIRLSRLIVRLDQEESIEHTLVHTGQNYDYELNEIFFRDLGLRQPDVFLNAAGSNSVETIASVMTTVYPVLERIRPDAMLILGDTNSCLAAIPAKRLKIPIFHMEAGNRCFDFRVPEEINRKIVDHISDINLTYSSIAREYLLREGCPPAQVIKTGSPMREVLKTHLDQIRASDVLRRLNLEPFEYFVVSMHREENLDDPINFKKAIGAINQVAQRFGKRIIFSTHPRTRQRLENAEAELDSQVELLKPLGFLDYVHLQENSLAVLSDSGTITEESSIMNFPAVNMREAHERPEGMEEGAVMMTGLNAERILQALSILVGQQRGEARTLQMVYDYEADNVSEKVLRIIVSYCDYVNRVVWSKR